MYQIKSKQLFRSDLESVWDFISSPRNLTEITPDYLDFEIKTTDLPEKMYPGMMISYRMKPLFRIPMTWVSEITHVEEYSYFVDEQRRGPYSLWHHEHFLKVENDGVLMEDVVSYRPPLGIFGSMLNQFILDSKLQEIFAYRKRVLDQKFNQSIVSI